MSTTQISPPEPVRARTSTEGKASKRNAPGKKRGAKLFLFVAAFLLIGGVVAVASGLLFKGSGAAASEIQLAEVAPKSFAVVLKEKGELKAAKSTDIKCEVEGRSTIISLIPEGTPVQQGDLLVTLASDEIENKIRESELKEANAVTAFETAKAELDIQRDKNESDIRKAELLIEIKKLELEKYLKGDWEQKLKDAQIAIDQAVITLDRRKQDFEASDQLYKKNYTTQTEYEEAKFNYQKAEWDLDKARMALEVLKTYTHEADTKQKTSDHEEAIKEADRVRKNAETEEVKKIRNVEGRQKELDLIQDQLAKFRTQKEKCRIVAPTQGFVVYYSGGGGGRWNMNGDQQIKEGAEVFERQVLMQLPDTSTMMVAVRIHEAKTDKLSIGQAVNVSVEGIPGRVFSGSVKKIAALADSQSSWLNPDLKEYETEIHLDPTDAPLKPGVTAHAEIMVTTVENELAVPVQAIYAKSGKRYVFRQKGTVVEPIPVQVGPVGNEWASISSGVESGDRILLAFSEDHRRMIPDLPAGEGRPGGAPGQRRRGPGGGGKPGAAPGGNAEGGKRAEAQPGAGDAKSAPSGKQEVAAKPEEKGPAVEKPAEKSGKPDSGSDGNRSSGKSP